MPAHIPVRALQQLGDPFENCPWHSCGCLSREGIAEALSTDNLWAKHAQLFGDRDHHHARVAYFVRYPELIDPIEVDVGVPALGCHVDWPITDGNHRFAAAIYLGLPTIPANVSGDLNYAEEIFAPYHKA